MNAVNRLVRDYFHRSSVLRTSSLSVAVLLFVGCVIGVWQAWSAPTEREEQVVRVTYSQRGAFGYSAQLTENVLYGPTTLSDRNTSVFFLSIVDDINGRFTYKFESDQPLQQVTHEVEIEAVLSTAEEWAKTIALVPKTAEDADFTITFPIDTDQLFELGERIEDEIGLRSGSYGLTIQATVNTTALTDYGAISEGFTHSISGSMMTAKLVWSTDTQLSQSQNGSLNETVIVPLEVGGGRIGWTIALAFVTLLGSYVVWMYLLTRPEPRAAIEVEAIQAKSKHKDVIVDVDGLPQAKAAGEMVISLDSLEELVKAADALFKPVLHKAEPDRHTYCVIDGHTRYEYVSLEPTPPRGGRR